MLQIASDMEERIKYLLHHLFTDSDVYMLSSTVSSTILGAIASVEGINFEVLLHYVALLFFLFS